MRIDSFGQIQQLYGLAGRQVKTQKESGSVFKDKLQISDAGRDYQTAKAAVFQAPDIRDDVIADIKSQIQKGTYDVAPEAFADKMLSQYAAEQAL